MTTHFSYPNVIPRESVFIGCGRYTVFSSEDRPKANYQEITDAPNTPNKTALEHSLQLIAPDSFDSEFSIFEKKDNKDKLYQGDSLDLAYFLAHISRARKLAVEIESDIWSTGVVQVFESQPVLRKVDQVGFDIKLTHFLSKECDDKLFIVPAANLRKPNIQKARGENARIISLNQLQARKSNDFNAQKTILKILPNELPNLVKFIFVTSQDRKKKKYVWLLVALMVCALGFVGWSFFSNRSDLPSPGDIAVLLESGRFDAALGELKKISNSDSSYHKLKEQIKKPLHVDIKFMYKMADERPDEVQLVDLTSQKGPTLSHRDTYRLQIESSIQDKNLFAYVFQRDQAGNLYGLFPNPSWENRNPVNIGQWPLNIPPEKDLWLYLDSLPHGWTAAMTESIHVLVSPWRANDIEECYDKFRKATESGDKTEKIVDRFLTQIRLRGADDMPGVYYREFSFYHGR